MALKKGIQFAGVFTALSFASIGVVLNTAIRSVDAGESSLLVIDSKQRALEEPNTKTITKLYEISVNAKVKNIDELCKTFLSTWIFKIFNQNPESDEGVSNIQLPNSFPVGGRFDILTVAARNDSTNEILFRWKSNRASIHGSLYFRLKTLSDKQQVIQYGTVISAPKKVDDMTVQIYHVENQLCLLASAIACSL